jgi:hypothetical protein
MPDTLVPGRQMRHWWTISATRARTHAVLAAIVIWLVAIVVSIGGSGGTNLAGGVNAPDFVQFYTLGRLAAEHRVAEAYDFQAFHDAQAALVPESSALIFPPVYPPQVAIAFMPLSRLPYAMAHRAWTAITIGLYALIVWRTWRTCRDRIRDPALVFAAAAAFPLFFQTVIYGQVTLLILLPCFLAWRAFERERHVAAGFALGLLAIKPQFGPVFAVIALMRRDWRMLGGAIAAVALQLLLVWMVLGQDVFGGYLSVLQTVAAQADALEAKPFQSHSLRALARLLPGDLGTATWLFASAVVLWRSGRLWCSSASLTARLGVAMLASVLINPHLIVYDAAILVLPLMWFGAEVLDHGSADDARRYATLLYGLFLAFFIPTAAVIKVQLSVVLMLWLFWDQSRLPRPAMPSISVPRCLRGES